MRDLIRGSLKDVAMLYWHLQPNNDPTSLLHQTLDPDFPAEDIYESDLDPTRTQWGQYQGEPCMFFNYSAKDSLKPLQERLIRTCSESIPSQHDESVELFQVDLRLGLLIDKHTDFNLPDTIPIRFQRVTRDGWKGLHPFGISGTDNYDKFLLSADNINFTIEEADGGATNLVGNPRWLAGLWPLKYDSLVKYVDADFSGKYYEMRWHPTPLSHYEVKRYDGEIENYCTCDTALTCYQTGYRNSQGQEIKFDRDKDRKLTQLTSPNRSWLHFSYGPSNHIAQIDDSQGRTVHYGYDERNRLISVIYPDGEIYHYEYDNTQHLLTFSVAPDAETTPRLVLRNEYEDGRIAKQTFADGSTYSYNYTLAKNGAIREASVHTPDGRIFKLEITEWDSTIREQDTHPVAEMSLSTPK
jgi:YD repeat-containing protein